VDQAIAEFFQNVNGGKSRQADSEENFALFNQLDAIATAA
jgi:hypothetical protein